MYTQKALDDFFRNAREKAVGGINENSPLLGRRVTLRLMVDSCLPFLEGCSAIVKCPDAGTPDKYFVLVTTRDGTPVSVKVLVQQMYQPPAMPSDAERLDRLAQKPPGSSKLVPCLESPHGIATLIYDISWPSHIASDPAAFLPAPDTDGIVRYWGLAPQDASARFCKQAVIELVTREYARFEYGVLPLDAIDQPAYVRKQSERFGLPEEQWIVKLVHMHTARLLSQRSARDAICAKSFNLRISMDRVVPPVFRTIRVPGAVALSTLVDKVLLPDVGWRRAYHDYCVMDPRNGVMFGPKSSTAVDAAFRPMHGYVFVNDDNVRLGDLLDKVGQRLHWTYDLGVRWEHTIEVIEVSSTPLPDGESHVRCLDGAGACPPEDGNGCDGEHQTVTQERTVVVNGKPTFETDSFWLVESGNDVYTRSIATNGCLRDSNHAKYRQRQQEVFDSRELAGNTSKSPFDWTQFSVVEANGRMTEALQTRKTDARFANVNNVVLSLPHPYSLWCDDPPVMAPQPVQKDPRALDLCAHCGIASISLKRCGKCVTRYCSVDCQRAAWKAGHKLVCGKSSPAASQ